MNGGQAAWAAAAWLCRRDFWGWAAGGGVPVAGSEVAFDAAAVVPVAAWAAW
jgi:hypothetical protein